MNMQDQTDEAITRAMRSASGTEPPLVAQVVDSFQGRTWWINIVGVPIMLAFLILGAYSAFRFFTGTEVRDLILWATLFLFSACTVAMFKVWYWMLLNRNAILREVKRLEVQVSRLNERRGH